MGKPVKNAYFDIVNMIGHQLFGRDQIGNVFYMHAAIFEITK